MMLKFFRFLTPPSPFCFPNGVCVPLLLVVTMCYAVLWHCKVARYMLPGARKGQHWIDKSESKAAAPSSSS
jgi:hypothetical protein